MDELISREVAIDALDEIESEVADGYGYQYEKWRKYFCELPSAQPEQPEQRWIPVSERLPKEFEKVLVTDGSSIDVRDIVSTIEIDGFCKWEDLYGYWEDIDVWTAWMPLPGPYKGGEQDG